MCHSFTSTSSETSGVSSGAPPYLPAFLLTLCCCCLLLLLSAAVLFFFVKIVRQGTYDLAAIYRPQLESLESILEDSNLGHYEKLVEPLPKRLTQEMLTAFDSRKERIRASLEEAILSRYSSTIERALGRNWERRLQSGYDKNSHSVRHKVGIMPEARTCSNTACKPCSNRYFLPEPDLVRTDSPPPTNAKHAFCHSPSWAFFAAGIFRRAWCFGSS